MVNLLKVILLKVFSMLPDSPFAEYYNNVHIDFYDYLNWFLPIDICASIFGIWLICIIVYYIYLIIVQIASLVIKGIAQTASIAAFFV